MMSPKTTSHTTRYHGQPKTKIRQPLRLYRRVIGALTITGCALVLALTPLHSGYAKSVELDRIETLYLRHVEKFLNDFDFLEGRFLQTNPDGSTKNGSYFMRNDGRLRFAYDNPDNTAIVSNGSQVGVVNKNTGKPESPLVPLSLTPLALLTERPANLRKNTSILDAQVHPSYVTFTVAEPDKEDQGSLQMYFNRRNFKLVGWITRQANGTPTAVQIETMVEGKRSDPRLFVIRQYDN